MTRAVAHCSDHPFNNERDIPGRAADGVAPMEQLSSESSRADRIALVILALMLDFILTAWITKEIGAPDDLDRAVMRLKELQEARSASLPSRPTTLTEDFWWAATTSFDMIGEQMCELRRSAQDLLTAVYTERGVGYASLLLSGYILLALIVVAMLWVVIRHPIYVLAMLTLSFMWYQLTHPNDDQRRY